VSWTTRRFRAGAAFALHRLDELPADQRAPFEELQRDADFYGLFVPRDGGTMKAAPRATAQLFLALSAPSCLDPGLLADDEYREDIVDLVLDGMLEIERDGAFVSGAGAFTLFFPETAAAGNGGRIAALSREAVQHGQALETADLSAITGALYSYNRIPLTRAWTTRFPDRDSVLGHLGARDAALRSILERHWVLVPESSAHGWISWARPSPQPLSPPAGKGAMGWKLYLSPRPEHIRDAFHALVRVLAGIPGAQMKIGPDAVGILRPDKLIAYFASKSDLETAAAALAEQLRGCPAHGVPFTAGVDHDGLLSWGVDPPDSERALSWLDRESWRLWIARSLASALVLAKREPSPDLPPWRFAVERVRRRGVDVDTWTPHDSLWRMQG
jgi:hypothetical protein